MSFDNIMNQVSKRSRSGAQSKKDDTDAVSFRFRRGSKDMFEELVEVGKTNKEAPKENTNKEAPKEKTNKEKKRKTSEGEEGGKKSRTRSSGRQPSTSGVIIIFDSQGRESLEQLGPTFCQYLKGRRARKKIRVPSAPARAHHLDIKN